MAKQTMASASESLDDTTNLKSKLKTRLKADKPCKAIQTAHLCVVTGSLNSKTLHKWKDNLCVYLMSPLLVSFMAPFRISCYGGERSGEWENAVSLQVPCSVLATFESQDLQVWYVSKTRDLVQDLGVVPSMKLYLNQCMSTFIVAKWRE